MNIDSDGLRQIGWPAPDEMPLPWKNALADHPAARPVRVIEQHRSGYIVADGPESGFAVESLPDWQSPRLASDQRPAVGDWLLIDSRAYPAPHDPSHSVRGVRHEAMPRALALLARRSTIKRAAAGERYSEQLIAANIDVAFIVTALDESFNTHRIERYLMLVAGGARPVLLFTKADMPGAAAQLSDAQAMLASQQIDSCVVDPRAPAAVALLAPWLPAGTTAVVIGSSGAGKSTLTNTLAGAERMKTGSVRASDARGRHTTTHRALICLPSGACLIDTPGMRELKPTGDEELDDSGFEDIRALGAECRFADCSHQSEPGCAILGAVEDGRLDAQRVANYLKLSAEIEAAAQRRSAREHISTGSRRISKSKQRRLDQRYGKE